MFRSNVKKTRAALSLLLSVLIVFPSLVCLVSCKPGEPPAPPEVKYHITEYKIIRPTDCSAEVTAAAVELRHALSDAGYPDIDLKEDFIKDGVPEDNVSVKEILIGATNRPASETAATALSDKTTYTVCADGNKLIILGGNDSLTATAVNYFIANLIPSITDGVLSLPETYKYISEPVPVIDIVKAGVTDFKIVYNEGLDNTVSSTNTEDKADMEVVFSKNLRSKLESITGADFGLSTDWVKRDEDPTPLYEILVGATSRAETAQFLSTIDFGEYGFGIIGNKIVIAGWTETTTQLAVNYFGTYVAGRIGTDADGKKNLGLLTDTRYVGANKDWFTDIPAYDGGKATGAQDAGYSCLQIFITETDAQGYAAYREKLVSSGYTLYMENDIGENKHATYTSEKGLLHVYFVPTEGAVRIVTCPKGNYELPKYTTAEAAMAGRTKITESKITQMNLNYAAGNFGMCYIITLEDGSFIIFDGGGTNSVDTERLYNLLKELNVRPDGKIVIAGWFLTHEHWDHFTNFQSFCQSYGKFVTIEAFYCNTASATFVYNSGNPNYYMSSAFSVAANAAGGITLVKLHTGMKFYVRNVLVEVLITQEDVYPKHITAFNDTTMVTRMNIAGQSVIWLGDIYYLESNALSSRYGNQLQCDILQVAHHGYNGGTKELYGFIKPETLLWPTSIANYTSQTAGRTDGYFGVDLYLAKELGVKKIIIAEPTQTITMPFKPTDAVVTNKN